MNILVSAASSGVAAALLILIVVGRFGVKRLRVATMVPLVVMLLFIFGVGPFFGLPAVSATKKNIRLLDAAYSARPLAAIISQIQKPNEPVAVYKVRRDMEYGLSFYRNHQVDNYDQDGIPAQEHILVTREMYSDQLRGVLAGRGCTSRCFPTRHKIWRFTRFTLSPDETLPACSQGKGRCRTLHCNGMTPALNLEILDLRHFSASNLKPVLDEESRVWGERLRWDFTASANLLLQYLDSHLLPGFVAIENGRICGYVFCVYENEKALVGDVFAMPSSGNAVPPAEMERSLLEHMIELLQHSPGVERIESQLLLRPHGTHTETLAEDRL